MDFRVDALLSMQRALWDVVTPGLRGVAVRLETDELSARFLFDHDPDDEDLEDVSLAETSVIADFPSDLTVSLNAIELQVGSPRALLPGEEWVYLRKEA